jgi:lipid II:glycine glycyltransferase (peptidoglycan interpeptide bridge formation enzyme)
LKIEIINPIEYPGWDELLLTNDQSIFFQTSAWARVLCESYNYTPLYFITKENDRLSSLIPVMEVNSFLTGKRGISLPFTDYCTPIANSEDQLSTLTEKLIDYGKQAGWMHVELRGGMNYLEKSPASATFVSHSLDLAGDEQQVFKSFRDSTRRNIKKAAKSNLQVTLDNSWQSVEAFYRLNSITRKHHGVPPQPKKFFRKNFEHIISRDKGIVVIASHRGIPVAGAVFFHFGKKALFKYGASIRKYHHLRPNNLLMWEVIRHYLQEGYQYLSFGKTETHNKGLMQFKKGWGTRERVLYYYTYDLVSGEFIARKKTFKSSYNFFKRMPEPILKLAGNLLYRHVG